MVMYCVRALEGAEAGRSARLHSSNNVKERTVGHPGGGCFAAVSGGNRLRGLVCRANGATRRECEIDKRCRMSNAGRWSSSGSTSQQHSESDDFEQIGVHDTCTERNVNQWEGGRAKDSRGPCAIQVAHSTPFRARRSSCSRGEQQHGVCHRWRKKEQRCSGGLRLARPFSGRGCACHCLRQVPERAERLRWTVQVAGRAEVAVSLREEDSGPAETERTSWAPTHEVLQLHTSTTSRRRYLVPANRESVKFLIF